MAENKAWSQVRVEPAGKVPRVGYLSPGFPSDPARQRRLEAVRQGLLRTDQVGHEGGVAIILALGPARLDVEKRPALVRRPKSATRFERARREVQDVQRLVGPSGLRQFVCYVPESMRAQLLARRHAQDAALDASRASPPASGPENA